MSEHDNTAVCKKPLNYDELFEGRFLKAGLLGGKPITLRIADVIAEKLPKDDGTTKKRGILVFGGTERQMVINTTNGQCLRAMFGTDLTKWVGKRVTLKPDRDRFGRETVDCIRIAGSPDLTGPVTVEIKLPRKNPRTVTLEKTGANREPGQEG